MFELISIEDERWDRLVDSFSEGDIYYRRGYVSGFRLHGDGEPLLLHYEAGKVRSICTVMQRPIENSDHFDIITPYGYGGFIWEGDPSAEEMQEFKTAFCEAMRENKVVTGFFRYHPLLGNADIMRGSFPVIDLGNTIHMDLDNAETVFQNLTSKNRNMIRKAEKNGVMIEHGTGMELMERFIPIYNSTMDRDSATDYYYFKKEFYESIVNELADNYRIFYAVFEGRIISMAIILKGRRYLHYHLSGSLPEYRHLAPTNLLLYKVALWGSENGYEKFHLGGGVGAGQDNLFKFKESFNRYSSNRFSIGKNIFDHPKYEELVRDRHTLNPALDLESGFFPLYRL